MKIIKEIENIYEAGYLFKIYDNLNLKEDYDVVFIKWNNDIEYKLNKKTILFIISDELHSMPEKYFTEHVEFIFKHYHPRDKSHPKLRPIPLGFLNGFVGHNQIKIKDRRIDYGFSGAWNEYRHCMIEAFEKRKNDGKEKYFLLNRNWASGFSMEDYSNILTHSKLSLCPRGYDSTESFRLIESSMCGNIILCEEPENFWFYKNFPYVKITDWSDLSIVDQILNKPESELQELSDRTYEWYKTTISPEAVAEYISNEVNSKI